MAVDLWCSFECSEVAVDSCAMIVSMSICRICVVDRDDRSVALLRRSVLVEAQAVSVEKDPIYKYTYMKI